MNLKQNAMKKIKNIKEVISIEYNDSKRMYEIYRNKNRTKKEEQMAKEQLKELRNLSLLFPIALLPGATIWITLTVKLCKKIGVDLKPKKTF